MRLILYGMYQTAKGQRNFGSVEAWQAAFDRLLQLEVFAPNEITFDQSKVKPEPTPAPTLTERQQVEQGFVDTVVPLLNEWFESLAKNFNGFRPSDADIEYLFGRDHNTPNPQDRGFFWRANLAPYDRRSFDICRGHMCDTGRWSESLLTPDEKFARNLEKMETPLDHLPADDRYTLINNLEHLRLMRR